MACCRTYLWMVFRSVDMRAMVGGGSGAGTHLPVCGVLNARSKRAEGSRLPSD
jgi:hypothetical protein